MEMITSIHNERVKRARSLREGRERKRRGFLLIEGSRFILEAVEAGARLRECFYSEAATAAEDRRLIALLEQLGVELVPVSHQVLITLADTQTPQGIIAVAYAPNQAGADVLTRGELVLVADEIRDPGNLEPSCARSPQWEPASFSWQAVLILPIRRSFVQRRSLLCRTYLAGRQTC